MLSTIVIAAAFVGILAEPLVVDENPHRFKGVGYDVGPGASEFERKHGIIPGGKGFIYDQPTEPRDVEVGSKGTCQMLGGLYIRPCQQLSSNDGQLMSTTDTRYYSGPPSNTYELDRTYYVGDSTCTPKESNIYYKLNLHGSISYHGSAPQSVQLNDSYWSEVCRAEMVWQNTTIILDDNAYGQQVASALGHYCPCGLKWAAPGTFNVDPALCSAADNASTYYTCKLITGAHDYFNFAVGKNGEYATSRDDFYGDPTTKGYVFNKVYTSYTRTKITQSHNHQANDCTPALRSYSCNGTAPYRGCSCLVDAEVNCKTCIGLECDGCLLRELDPNFNASVANNLWHYCCPCIQFYDNTNRDLKWNVLC